MNTINKEEIYNLLISEDIENRLLGLEILRNNYDLNKSLYIGIDINGKLVYSFTKKDIKVFNKGVVDETLSRCIINKKYVREYNQIINGLLEGIIKYNES